LIHCDILFAEDNLEIVYNNLRTFSGVAYLFRIIEA